VNKSRPLGHDRLRGAAKTSKLEKASQAYGCGLRPEPITYPQTTKDYLSKQPWAEWFEPVEYTGKLSSQEVPKGCKREGKSHNEEDSQRILRPQAERMLLADRTAEHEVPKGEQPNEPLGVY